MMGTVIWNKDFVISQEDVRELPVIVDCGVTKSSVLKSARCGSKAAEDNEPWGRSTITAHGVGVFIR